LNRKSESKEYENEKHYTVLILVTLLITLSACARPDVDKNDAVPELPVETEAAEEQAYIEDSTEDSIEDFIEDPPEDSVQDAESSLETESEEEIKEETEWLETDEQWRGRRTRSNSELEVTIERTDYSIYNEDGLTMAIIYYDRPVVSGDSVAAEKITEFFEKEEQDWFAGTGRLLDFPGNDYDNLFDCFLGRVADMRGKYGDEDVAVEPGLYSLESRIMYMDDNILSILQIKEKRAERGGHYYYGCTFDLHTGELLELTDLDISAEDIRNIFSKDKYLDHFSEMSEDYIVVAYEEEFDMTYQFYVDKKYLYLLDNTVEKYNDGIIYRIDEAGELVTLRYVVEREDNKNRIYSRIITKDGALW
jgi:hypothetical protein